MERDGLLTVEGDRHLLLTDAGRAKAVAVMRKHRLAELLLVNVIGLPYEDAHDEACRWEHVMSEAVEQRVYDLLGQPTRSPYGNPIPGLDDLGSAHRYNFRRRFRNLERLGRVRFTRVETEADRATALRELVALHQMRWQPRGGSSAFDRPTLVDFHDELSALALARGWLRLFTLRLDDIAIAAVYGFRYRDTFSFYQSGFDPRLARASVRLIAVSLSSGGRGEGAGIRLPARGPTEFHWARRTRRSDGSSSIRPHLRGRLTAARSGRIAPPAGRLGAFCRRGGAAPAVGLRMEAGERDGARAPQDGVGPRAPPRTDQLIQLAIRHAPDALVVAITGSSTIAAGAGLVIAPCW
jgi:Mn-dependent DtxR family transcriptional regulator